MMAVTDRQIREYVVEKLGEGLALAGISAAELSDETDLLESGIIDSIGLLQLIVEVEDFVGCEIDFEELDAEDLTRLGTFCRFILTQAVALEQDH